MTILAIDSAIGISSVAIWHGGKVAVYLENREFSMQSARLMPLVEQALSEANLDYKDLTHVAATTGPGSFTGIRIGLAAARGIAFAAGIPSLGFSTLRVMAAALRHPDESRDPEKIKEMDSVFQRNDNALCILNAGKGEVYFQYFGKNACEPTIGTMEQALAHADASTRIASGIALPEGYPTPLITHPRADALATLAANHAGEAAALAPFYIRPPDAKPQNTLVSF